MAEAYRLWVNAESTVLVRMWRSGNVEVALRDDSSHTWGPPIVLVEEGPRPNPMPDRPPPGFAIPERGT